jgi:Lrp/AsnC family leucine-responsive transcriptional regulator
MLAMLRDDARLPVAAIGRALHLSHPAVHERLRRLTREGYIRGYHADLDYGLLGFGLTAYVGVQIQQAEATRSRMAEALREIPEVEMMAWLTGDFDVLLRVHTRGPEHLQDIVFRIINAGEGRVRSRTMVVMSVPFEKPGPGFESLPPSTYGSEPRE